MMVEKINELLIRLKPERDYSERQVLREINTIRSILDRNEKGVKEGTVKADDGLQGNEWRLYKELSNLERYNEIIKELEELK
jgi:hypothetical protein